MWFGLFGLADDWLDFFGVSLSLIIPIRHLLFSQFTLAVSMLLGKSALKQSDYSHHLAAITPKRSDMLIHVIELNYLMLIEVFPNNDLHFAIQFV